MSDENPLDDLAPIGNTAVAPAVGVAGLALTLAMKYHDINTVQDGTLYQQYKLEGKNMQPLHLDMVFETALRMEAFLVAAPGRVSKMIFDAIAEGIEESPEEGGEAADGAAAIEKLEGRKR